MIDISELTLDEFYKAFSAKNCNSNEELLAGIQLVNGVVTKILL